MKRNGKYVEVTCHVCGAGKEVHEYDYKNVMANTGLFFCNRAHYWEWRKGDGARRFQQAFKEAAKRGSTRAANQAALGSTPWNKGLTKHTSEIVKASAAKRAATYDANGGLANHARCLMIKHKQGAYTGCRERLPAAQRRALDYIETRHPELDVCWEYFCIVGENQPIFVDIAVPSLRLAIEIDGKSHRLRKQRARDAARDAALTAMGWTTVRISNEAAIDNPSAMERTIERCLHENQKN